MQRHRRRTLSDLQSIIDPPIAPDHGPVERVIPIELVHCHSSQLPGFEGFEKERGREKTRRFQRGMSDVTLPLRATAAFDEKTIEIPRGFVKQRREIFTQIDHSFPRVIVRSARSTGSLHNSMHKNLEVSSFPEREMEEFSQLMVSPQTRGRKEEFRPRFDVRLAVSSPPLHRIQMSPSSSSSTSSGSAFSATSSIVAVPIRVDARGRSLNGRDYTASGRSADGRGLFLQEETGTHKESSTGTSSAYGSVSERSEKTAEASEARRLRDTLASLEREMMREKEQEKEKEKEKEWRDTPIATTMEQMEEDEVVMERIRVELEVAKETNRKLTSSLARLERDRQSLLIEQQLTEQRREAAVASGVADAIHSLSRSSDSESSLRSRKSESSFDQEAIRSECVRMLRILKEESDEEKEQKRREQREKEKELEKEKQMEQLRKEKARMKVDMDAISDALNNSQALLDTLSQQTASSSYGSVSGDEDMHAESQILSLRNQVAIHQQTLENKETLIQKLAHEMEEAQRCNQQLNAQIGSLATQGGLTVKREIVDLKKELKDRTNEIDQLKKKVLKADRDRQQWDHQKRQLESKLPMDVQLLMSQKRELTLQLEREESEKHELFMQINSLIGQLAETNGQQNGKDDSLIQENDQLRQRIMDMENLASKETEKALEELRRYKHETEIQKASSDLSSRRLASEVDQLQKELQMKSAALQSLMLAKPEPKSDTAELDRLRAECAEAEQQAKEWERKMREVEEEVERVDGQRADSERKAAGLGEELAQLQKTLEEEREKATLASSAQSQASERISELEQSLKTLESERDEWRGKLESSEREHKNSASLSSNLESVVASLETKLKTFEKEVEEKEKALHSATESLRRVEFEKAETAKQAETQRSELEKEWMKEKEERESLLSTVSSLTDRVDIAEREAATARALAENHERRATALTKQLEAEGGQGEQVSLLRDELAKAESRCEQMVREAREREEKSEAALRDLRKQLADAESKTEDAQKKQKEGEGKITTITATLTEKEKRCIQLEKEVEEKSAECRKLEQRASVGDELLTLVASLQTARQENGELQAQLPVLEKEIHELRRDVEQMEKEKELAEKEKELAEKEKEQAVADSAHWREQAEQWEHKEKQHVEKITLLTNASTRFEEHKKSTAEEGERAKREWEEKERTLSSQLSSTEAKLAALTAEIEASRQTVKRLEDERAHATGSSDEEKKRLNAENSRLSAEVSTLSASLASSNEKLRASEEKEKKWVEREQEKEQKQREKLAELKEKLERAQKEAKEAKSDVESTRHELEEMRAAATSHGKNLQESEEMAEKIRQQLKEIEAEHREQINQLESKQTANLQKLQADLDTVEKEKTLLASAKTQLEEEVTSLRKELEQEKEKEEKETGEEKDSLVAENERLAMELMRAEAQVKSGEQQAARQYEIKLKEKEAELSVLSSQLKEVEGRLGHVSTECERAKKEKEEQEKKLEEAREVQSAMQSDISEVEREKAQLARQLETTRLEMNKLRLASGHSAPVAPPRRSMSSVGYDHVQGEAEETAKLKSDIARQQRLIIVLRRKLQGL